MTRKIKENQKGLKVRPLGSQPHTQVAAGSWHEKDELFEACGLQPFLHKRSPINN